VTGCAIPKQSYSKKLTSKINLTVKVQTQLSQIIKCYNSNILATEILVIAHTSKSHTVNYSWSIFCSETQINSNHAKRLIYEFLGI
jgi:hypothetical protein